jgi:hypothetical protein
MKTVVLAIATLCTPFLVTAQTVTSGGAQGSTGTGVVFRQSGVATSSTGPVLAQSRIDRIAAVLDLNQQQKSSVQVILDAEGSKMEAFLQEATASGQDSTADQMRAKQELLRQESVANVRSILTATQLHTLEGLAPDQVSQLFSSSSGMLVRMQQPSDALCDSSGKCISR